MQKVDKDRLIRWIKKDETQAYFECIRLMSERDIIYIASGSAIPSKDSNSTIEREYMRSIGKIEAYREALGVDSTGAQDIVSMFQRYNFLEEGNDA
jgi:hypothetical protein